MTASRIMFVAGDPSGDHHAAAVLRRLHALRSDLSCFGVGGPAMAAAGFQPLLPFAPFNRMGFVEVATHLPFFLRAKRRLVRALEESRPAALVCVDYPGLNIPLAEEAKRLGIPVVWYIAPQVWAWKPHRAESLGRCAAFIGVVFPFETRYFEGFGAEVKFVGHPLMEAMTDNAFDAIHRRRAQWRNTYMEKALHLGILPGSRAQEVGAMLAPMVDAFRLLRLSYPGLTATVSRFAPLPQRLFRCTRGVAGLEVSTEPLDGVLARTDCAFVTSGTATLQTALWQAPMVVAYRTSRLTYAIMRRMVKLPYIGLPNIVAQKKIVPECIQRAVNRQDLAAAMRPFIEAPAPNAETADALARLADMLGPLKPSREMADAIVRIVGRG
jgi:lipid-A-disaccharide synthase